MQKLKSHQVSGFTSETTPNVRCKFRCYTKYNTKLRCKTRLKPSPR